MFGTQGGLLPTSDPPLNSLWPTAVISVFNHVSSLIPIWGMYLLYGCSGGQNITARQGLQLSVCWSHLGKVSWWTWMWKKGQEVKLAGLVDGVDVRGRLDII